jgi:hypothetical protein
MFVRFRLAKAGIILRTMDQKEVFHETLAE